MKTRITTKPKRCLKFEGYIYLPEKNISAGGLRYFASRTPGRIFVYDEFGNKINERAFAFDNWGDAVSFVEKIRRKIFYKRTKNFTGRKN